MAESQDRAPETGSKKKGSSTMDIGKILTYSALAISLGVAGWSGLAHVEDQSFRRNVVAAVKTNQTKIKTLTSKKTDSQLDKKQLDKVASDISGRVLAVVRKEMDETAKGYAYQVRNDLLVKVSEQIESAAANTPTPVFDDAHILRLVQQAMSQQPTSSTIDELARAKVNALYREVSAIRSQVTNLKTAPTAKAAQRLRLKEFNIVSDGVLKNGELFIIDAPKKNGKPNSITLTINEPFRSKLGSHKVESAQKLTNGQYRLLISGGYYIDTKREEFSKTELASMANKKTAKSRAVNKVMPKSRVARSSKSQVPTGKQVLKDWYVVTTKPDSQEVVVFNPKNAVPMRLTKNMYIDGVGTVRDINFETGEISFERYYIQGIQ